MVTLSAVQASNSLIASSLPPHLVAVFVGATSGIGEASLKAFAKHARQPRVYFVGRNQDAENRIKAECKTLNPEGEYVFIKADVSLIRVVDDVCREIKSKETAINVLFLSQGSLVARTGMCMSQRGFGCEPLDKSRKTMKEIRNGLNLEILAHEYCAGNSLFLSAMSF